MAALIALEPTVNAVISSDTNITDRNKPTDIGVL
jgi:hypothetical protein